MKEFKQIMKAMKFKTFTLLFNELIGEDNFFNAIICRKFIIFYMFGKK